MHEPKNPLPQHPHDQVATNPPPGLVRRALRALFPPQHLEPCDWDKPEPGFAPGEFCTDVDVFIGWPDRLRILVSGRAHVRVRTATDVTVGLAKSRSVFYVGEPRFFRDVAGDTKRLLRS